jgi:hypothetical protein
MDESIIVTLKRETYKYAHDEEDQEWTVLTIAFALRRPPHFEP